MSILFGTSGDDQRVGTSAGDVIDAGAGSDTIITGDGNDLITVEDPYDGYSSSPFTTIDLSAGGKADAEMTSGIRAPAQPEYGSMSEPPCRSHPSRETRTGLTAICGAILTTFAQPAMADAPAG